MRSYQLGQYRYLFGLMLRILFNYIEPSIAALPSGVKIFEVNGKATTAVMPQQKQKLHN